MPVWPPGHVAVRYSLPYGTFAVIFDSVRSSARVIEAAPIAKWTRGHTRDEVDAYYRRKRADLVVLP